MSSPSMTAFTAGISCSASADALMNGDMKPSLTPCLAKNSSLCLHAPTVMRRGPRAPHSRTRARAPVAHLDEVVHVHLLERGKHRRRVLAVLQALSDALAHAVHCHLHGQQRYRRQTLPHRPNHHQRNAGRGRTRTSLRPSVSGAAKSLGAALDAAGLAGLLAAGALFAASAFGVSACFGGGGGAVSSLALSAGLLAPARCAQRQGCGETRSRHGTARVRLQARAHPLAPRLPSC